MSRDDVRRARAFLILPAYEGYTFSPSPWLSTRIWKWFFLSARQSAPPDTTSRRVSGFLQRDTGVRVPPTVHWSSLPLPGIPRHPVCAYDLRTAYRYPHRLHVPPKRCDIWTGFTTTLRAVVERVEWNDAINWSLAIPWEWSASRIDDRHGGRRGEDALWFLLFLSINLRHDDRFFLANFIDPFYTGYNNDGQSRNGELYWIFN